MSVSMRYGSAGTGKPSASTEPIVDLSFVDHINFILRETGTFSISAKTAVTQTDVDIDFEEIYTSAPRILVVGNNASASVYGLPTLTANSTTGATVRLRNTAAHSASATFRWFTVETVTRT